MPHKRPVRQGSFGAHFDELVKHFAHQSRQPQPEPDESARRDLREKRDIHALLFEQAWRLEEMDSSGDAR